MAWWPPWSDWSWQGSSSSSSQTWLQWATPGVGWARGWSHRGGGGGQETFPFPRELVFQLEVPISVGRAIGTDWWWRWRQYAEGLGMKLAYRSKRRVAAHEFIHQTITCSGAHASDLLREFVQDIFSHLGEDVENIAIPQPGHPEEQTPLVSVIPPDVRLAQASEGLQGAPVVLTERRRSPQRQDDRPARRPAEAVTRHPAKARAEAVTRPPAKSAGLEPASAHAASAAAAAARPHPILPEGGSSLAQGGAATRGARGEHSSAIISGNGAKVDRLPRGQGHPSSSALRRSSETAR